MSIRTKLVCYIFLTITVTFAAFGVYTQNNEKKQWEAYKLEQTLAFTSFSSGEIVKLFGRDIKARGAQAVFTGNVEELLGHNKDLVKFIVQNVNGLILYNSEFYDDYLSDSERKEIKDIERDSFAQSGENKEQAYRIIMMESGRKIIDVIKPVIHVTGLHIMTVRYFVSYSSVEKKLNALRQDFYIAALFTCSVSLLLLIVISKKITDSIFVLTAMVKKMQSGDFDARIENSTDDEIGELSLAFNNMVGTLKTDREAIRAKNKALLEANVELKELQEQLIKSERLAAIGQLAAGVSHEIDNPIGIILGYAEYIKSELDKSSPLNEDIDNIINESKRCRRIVGGLLNFSKKSPSHIEEADLNGILRETIDALSVQNIFKHIKLIEEYDSDLPFVKVDIDKIKQVIINLLINAAQALKGEGNITVSTRLMKYNGEQFVNIRIKDSGTGIPMDNIKKIFDPFFTTKSTGKGTGLGLSISRKLIEEHKGRINVESVIGEGTAFTITIPL